MVDLAHHYYDRLSVVHINLESLVGIGAKTSIANPIAADVVRIKAPRISGNKDELVTGARGIRIDRHTLR